MNFLEIDKTTQFWIGFAYFVMHVCIYIFGIGYNQCEQEQMIVDRDRILKYAQIANPIQYSNPMYTSV